MLLVPVALALSLMSIACLAVAPLALAIAAAVVVWGAVADVEFAIVVSKRRPDGARGQRVVWSVRLTPRRAARGAARGAAGALTLARRAAEAVARGAGALAETETAGRWADRARTLADVGPAVGVLCAVWALPWIAIVAPDGAGAAVGVGAALALARHLTATAGARYRVDV